MFFRKKEAQKGTKTKIPDQNSGNSQRKTDYEAALERCEDRWRHRESNDVAASEWLISFRNTRAKAWAILQRENRLKRYLSEANNASSTEEGPSLPTYDEALRPSTAGAEPHVLDATRRAEIQKEITKGRQEYKDCITSLYELELSTPDSREVDIALLNTKYGDDGRCYYWMLDRERCSDEGGCCRRGCGCCEKPLLEYSYFPGRSHVKKKANVFGHCTNECECCIRNGWRASDYPPLSFEV